MGFAGKMSGSLLGTEINKYLEGAAQWKIMSIFPLIIALVYFTANFILNTKPNINMNENNGKINHKTDSNNPNTDDINSQNNDKDKKNFGEDVQIYDKNEQLKSDLSVSSCKNKSNSSYYNEAFEECDIR